MNVCWNKGNERKVYDRIRTRLTGEPCHMIRVENVAEQGTPDINLRCWGRKEIWIETKYIKDLKGIPLRPAQHAWHYKRSLTSMDAVCILAGNEDWFVVVWPSYQYHEGVVKIPETSVKQLWKNTDGKKLLDILFGVR